MLLSTEKSRNVSQNDVLTDKTVYMKDYTLSRGNIGKLRKFFIVPCVISMLLTENSHIHAA